MQYIQLQSQAAGATPTPGEGKFNFFIDDADGLPKIKDDNGTIITVDGSTQTLTSLTYEAFIELIMNNELTKGYFYEINDYETCYDQPDFSADGDAITTGNYKTSNQVEPIIVFATAAGQIATEAFQAAYPKDKIKYDWTFGFTEVTNNPAKGRIIERIDEFNNRTDYDHRNILFKRYTMYYPNQKLTGAVTMVGGVVTGVGTTFTSLSTGDRIYIGNYDNSDLEYMITEIVDDTNMTVTGITYNNTYESDFFTTNSITGYKRNNTTDPSTFEEHYTFNLGNDNGDYYINNYIGNYGNLKDRDNNTFYLANNVFIGGDYINNTIGDDSYNNTFDDDCDGNVIGAGFRNNTTNDDFDRNQIGNNFRNNIITSEFDRNQIGNNFYDNIIICDEDFDDNQIGNNFYDNIISCDDFYRNQIGNDFNSNTITGNDDFQNNVIGNQFNSNTITQDFIKNNIANGYNQNEILVTFEGNIVGNGFNGNNITDGEFYDNIIGQYFEDNAIAANFNRNSIGLRFYGNNISFTGDTISFSDNQILNDCENNTITVDFEDNLIGNDFDYNTFNRNVSNNGSVYRNNIGHQMSGNGILGDFNENTISSYFQNNNIKGLFYQNQISDSFQSNTTPMEFRYNEIKYNVNNTDFTVNNRFIQEINYTTPTSTTDASYGGLTGVSSGDGTGAIFQVDVVSNVVNSVIATSNGHDYLVGETVTIPASSFGGDGEDLVITVSSVNPQAMVTGDYNCKISRSPFDGGILIISTETPMGLYAQSQITEIFLD
jgi:hypothetical protein